MLASLSAPALALAHGHVHEHLVSRHHGAASTQQHGESIGEDHHAASHEEPREHHDAILKSVHSPLAGVSQPSQGEHQHGHPALSAVTAARDVIRWQAAPIVAIAAPPAAPVLTTIRVVRSAHQTNRSTLARPDPEQGPPPALRAPPIA